MGVEMRKKLDEETGEESELEGIHIPLFNYTSKEILAIGVLHDSSPTS